MISNILRLFMKFSVFAKLQRADLETVQVIENVSSIWPFSGYCITV